MKNNLISMFLLLLFIVQNIMSQRNNDNPSKLVTQLIKKYLIQLRMRREIIKSDLKKLTKGDLKPSSHSLYEQNIEINKELMLRDKSIYIYL